MDLLDVERELRSHLTTRPVPRAPEGLVARTRVLHRRRRRHQAAAVGVVLAVALLFGSVPVLRGALPDVGRSDAASPSSPSSSGETSLYDLPARGSLADDGDWLAAVATLPWDDGGRTDLPEPSLDSHRVLYADDVPGARVALVMGADGAALASAWFTGPAGAGPQQMTQAAPPERAFPDQPLALLDDPSDGGAGLLVVLSRPGDAMSYLQGQQVAADGSTAPDRTSLTVADGIAVTTVPVPGSPLAGSQVTVDRRGEEVYSLPPTLSDRAAASALAPLAVADPRRLRSAVDESSLQTTLHWALSAYGSGADGVTPVLLAAGRPPGHGDPQVVLVGLTFPSGATALFASRYAQTADGSSTGSGTSLGPVASGTPLLEQLLDRKSVV